MVFNKYTQFDKLLTFLPNLMWVALQSLRMILSVLGWKMFVLCIICIYWYLLCCLTYEWLRVVLEFGKW